MKRKLQLVYVLALVLSASSTFAQSVLGFEDFDGNPINLNSTTNVSDYGLAGGSGGDVFGRVNGQPGGTGMPFDVADDTQADVSGAGTGDSFPGDTSGLVGQNSTAFFALNDADGVTGSPNNATWTFSGWGAATLTSIEIDLGAIGDFEASSSDGFLIEAALNGGEFQELFRAETNESASKTYRALDGGFIPDLNDPLELFIDGSSTSAGFLDKSDPATGNFDTFTSTLFNGAAAESVSIRLSWSGSPSGSEPMGIDNISIQGETSSVLPLLLSEVTVTPTEGEFIEIFNPNSTTVELTDIYLTDATFSGTSTYYYNIVTGTNAGGGGFGDFLARFPDGATIAPGEYQTIAINGSEAYNSTYGTDPTYELYEDAAAADAVPDMREGLPGSINNQGGLTNSGEVAILFYWDGESDLVTDLDYVIWGDTNEAVDKTGISIDGPDADDIASTDADDTALENQVLVSASGHANGDSFQRQDIAEGNELSRNGNGVNGDDETSEDVNNTWCISTSTAGLENGCTVAPPVTVLISEVQGNTGTSPLVNTSVVVEAIVIGDYQQDNQLRGFFIQEEDTDADADPMTSEAVFVFCQSCPVEVNVGDLVEVSGTVVEAFGNTQIEAIGSEDLTLISSANSLPSPAELSFPAPAGTDLESTYESVENMLITYTTDLVVSEYFELARYGQLVLTANTRTKQFTDANEPDVAGYAAYLDNLEASRIILDDDNNIQNSNISGSSDEAYFWPRPGLSNTNRIRGGDQISNLTGIMHWSFAGQNGTNAWRIRPVLNAFTYDFASSNPRPASPEVVGGDLKIASFNVLNYFTTLNERGANSNAELNRQREKIAAAICGMEADIVGLIEIENNGLEALDDLLNGPGGINTVCDNTYVALEAGVIGSDQIAVAFIYNPATVSLVGDFAILDSSVDPRFIDDSNRPVLAQTFRQIFTDGVLTVAVNHLKSKGSSCAGDPDLNDGAGNCNQTRAEAAAALVDWLATDPTGSEDPDYLIIGDLNSYRNEDPIDNILLGSDDSEGTADDYTDLVEDYQGEAAYSYVFDGQLGYLDYALANNSLAEQVTGTTVWHINADEVSLFDYNDDVQDSSEASFQRKSSALPIYQDNAFRASDHDPVLVGLELEPTLSSREVSFESNILLFPNPAKETLNLINQTQSGLSQATIRDMTGKTIQVIDLSDMAIQKQLNISQLAAGMYLITIESQQNFVVKRIVKE
jgi:predicted extracellular nuclease